MEPLPHPISTRHPPASAHPNHHLLLPSPSGSTPLHFAAANNHLSTISLLLSFGARASATEKHGLTAEAIAAQKGFAAAADLLRAAPGPSIVRRSSAAGTSTAPSAGGQGGTHQARRRPSLPALMERAAHPGASLHAAIGRVRRDSDALRPAVKEARGNATVEDVDEEEDRRRRRRSAEVPTGHRSASRSRIAAEEAPMSAPATKTSFNAADLARSHSNMTLGSQVGSASSLAHSFYRPRQSSQLSGRTQSSFGGGAVPGSPRVFIDDEDDYTLEDEYSESNREDSTPSHSFKRAPSLLRSSFDPRHHQRYPSNASSMPSTGSENPNLTDQSDSSAPPSLSSTTTANTPSTPARLRGFVTQSRANTIDSSQLPTESVVGGRAGAVTRSHRSDSTGTDGRFSQSSATSSYSGPGTVSTYAPSASTVGTSVTGSSPKPQVTPLVARVGAGLTPLYETGGTVAPGKGARHPSPSRASASTGSSAITTSAEARSKVQQVEQELLAFDRKGGPSSAAGGMTLAQQLAAYGQSLSLERALAAKEREAQTKAYHLETIGTSMRSHLVIPTLTSQPSSSKLSSSASTVLGTTPTPSSAAHNHNHSHSHAHHHHPSPSGLPGTPTWAPQDRQLRLAPPGQSDRANGRRSVSPMGTSGPTRRLPGRDPTAFSAPPKATSISSGSSSVTPSSITPLTIPPPAVTAPGTAPFDLVVVSPASSASGSARPGRASGERRGSGEARSERDRASSKPSGSVTSGKEQVLMDAEERGRIEAAIPKAVLTVPKKSKGFGGLFGRKK